jgi:hypothetical protein
MSRIRTTRTVASLGLLLALGLAGCSSGGPPGAVASLGGGSSSAAPSGGAGQQTDDPAEQDARLKFAQCMRRHGVNMPDPVPGHAMPALTAPNAAAQQKIKDADTACAALLPNGGQSTPAQTERALKFAQCMRQHGVDVPDPKGGSGMSLSMNLSDPKAKAALAVCDQGAPGAAANGG